MFVFLVGVSVLVRCKEGPSFGKMDELGASLLSLSQSLDFTIHDILAGPMSH